MGTGQRTIAQAISSTTPVELLMFAVAALRYSESSGSRIDVTETFAALDVPREVRIRYRVDGETLGLLDVGRETALFVPSRSMNEFKLNGWHVPINKMTYTTSYNGRRSGMTPQLARGGDYCERAGGIRAGGSGARHSGKYPRAY